MSQNKKYLLFIWMISIAFFCFMPRAFGQTNCSDPLPTANKHYAEGRLQACIQQLEPCLSSISDKESLFEAYRLLALCYHVLKLDSPCDVYIKKMLELRPRYLANPNNEMGSFAKALRAFHVSPKFALGFGSGTTINTIKLEKSYAATTLPQSYLPSSGYQLNAFGSYQFSIPLIIRGEVSFGYNALRHHFETDDGFYQHYAERLQYMNYALSASTFFPLTKNLSIHGGLRIGLSHIHAAKVTVLTHYANNEELTIYSQNALPYRIQLQPNFGPMLGLDYSINHGTLSVGISYLNYFKTTVDPQGRYKDLDFNITTGYVNDAIRMRLWGINLSYQKTLNFRVKKKPY